MELDNGARALRDALSSTKKVETVITHTLDVLLKFGFNLKVEFFYFWGFSKVDFLLDLNFCFGFGIFA